MNLFATVILLAATAGAGKPPTSKELDALWADLSTADPVKAHQTSAALVAGAGETVSFLRKRVRAVPIPDTRCLARLLGELDDERFEIRQKATRKLEQLAETAEPALKKALASDPSPEARRRIEKLLDKLKKDRLHPLAERVRLVRAVEVLELIGSPEAWQVLAALSRGAPEAQLTLEAKTALERLTQTPDRMP